MLSLGLTAAQDAELMRRLSTDGYELKTTVQILTPEHAVVRTVSHVLLDGQVDVVAPTWNRGDIQVGRVARFVFVDPARTLALDSQSPADGAFYLWIDLRHATGGDVGAWAEEFLRTQRVALAPGSAFGASGEGWVRVCAAASRGDLLHGLSLLPAP